MSTVSETDAVIHIEPSLQGYRAWGMLFDSDANVLAETESRQFIGYTESQVRELVDAELRSKVTTFIVYCEQTGAEKGRFTDLDSAQEKVEDLNNNWFGYTYFIREENEK